MAQEHDEWEDERESGENVEEQRSVQRESERKRAVDERDPCTQQPTTDCSMRSILLGGELENTAQGSCFTLDDAAMSAAAGDTSSSSPSDAHQVQECEVLRVPRHVKVAEIKLRLKQRRKVRWDEEVIEQHMKERGVLYSTMKVDQPDTPFLFYDSEDESHVEIFSRSTNHEKVSVEALQARLGLLTDSPAQLGEPAKV